MRVSKESATVESIFRNENVFFSYHAICVQIWRDDFYAMMMRIRIIDSRAPFLSPPIERFSHYDQSVFMPPRLTSLLVIYLFCFFYDWNVHDHIRNVLPFMFIRISEEGN